MPYEVVFKKKVLKGIRKLSIRGQKKMAILATDLRDKGPEQSYWQNYNKLTRNKYRCHLGNSLVVCWRLRKNSMQIEVNYVGSREKAPY